MSFPNFFKRKSLLPNAPQPSDAPPAPKLDPPSTENPEVYTRPTVIPELSPDEHAAAAMRSCVENEAANTAPAPRLERPSPGAEFEAEYIETRIEPVNWAKVTQSGSGEATHAIPPPARVSGATLWNSGKEGTGRTLSDLVVDGFGALDFVDGLPRSTHRPQPDSGDAPTSEEGNPEPAPNVVSISELYAVGDFSGALAAAEATLAANPVDEDARRYADDCRRVLLKMCEARIGPFTQRPMLAMGSEQIRWLALDHREGFLLSMIDGSSSVDDLLDISGMPRLEALRIFAALMDKGVIRMR